MRKFGLLALIICLIMAFAPGISAQEYQPQETYVKVYLEGELLEQTFDISGSMPYLYSSGIPAAYVLRAMGYEVSYDAEQYAVVAVKGDTAVTIHLSNAGVEKRANGKTQEFQVYPSAREVEGTTYVGESFFRDVLGYYAVSRVEWDAANDNIRYKIVDIFDLAPYGAGIAEQVNTLYQRQQEAQVDLSKPVRFSSEGNYKFHSKLLGTTVEGKVASEMQFMKKDDAFYFNMELSTEGLANLCDILLNAGEGMPDYSGVDFDKPMNLQYCLSQDGIYIKSAEVAGYLSNMYRYDRLTSEEKERLKTLWIKVGEVPPAIEAPPFTAEFGVSIIQSMIYSYQPSNPKVYAEYLIETFQELCARASFAKDEKTGALKYALDIDKAFVEQQALKFAGGMAYGYQYGQTDQAQVIAGQIKAVTEFFDGFDCRYKATETYENKTITSGSIDIGYSLLNIPNIFKLPIGSFDFTFVSNYQTDETLKMDLPLPDASNSFDIDNYKTPQDL